MPNPTPFTNVDVMSQAMVALGENPITNVNSTDKRVQAMVLQYKPVVYYCLAMSNWRALTADADLVRLSGVPVSRWSYAFQLPNDLLKVITTWPISNYEIRNRQLYSNESTCSLTYIRLIEEAYWPAWLTRYVVAELVMRTCRPITGDAPDDVMRNERDTSLSSAYFNDAQQQPNQTIDSDDFTTCRN